MQEKWRRFPGVERTGIVLPYLVPPVGEMTSAGASLIAAAATLSSRCSTDPVPGIGKIDGNRASNSGNDYLPRGRGVAAPSPGQSGRGQDLGSAPTAGNHLLLLAEINQRLRAEYAKRESPSRLRLHGKHPTCIPPTDVAWTPAWASAAIPSMRPEQGRRRADSDGHLRSSLLRARSSPKVGAWPVGWSAGSRSRRLHLANRLESSAKSVVV